MCRKQQTSDHRHCLYSLLQFDLPSVTSPGVAQSQAQAGAPQADQMAAFQKMMEQMGQNPGSGNFAATRPPAGLDVAGASGSKGKDDGEHNKWVSIYPIYFDAKRHYRKGCRRVAYDKASPFPTQLWIAKAVGRLQLKYVQEPFKTHPQDWENPGRVKVHLFNEEGSPVDSRFPSKKQLFDAIAQTIQPNCGGKPPAIEPRKKRVRPSTIKKQALAENAKAAASGSSTAADAGSGSSKKNKKKAAAAAASASGNSAVGPSKPALTKEQRKQVLAAKRDPNPNPIRERLAKIRYPPTLEARLPAHSPAIEGGLLNMNLAEAMGGMPPGMPGADALGGLGGMLGGMGLGGDDDEEEEEEAQDEAASRKKDPMNPLNLGRRQRKKMVRIGR